MIKISQMDKFVLSIILGSNNCASGYEIRTSFQADFEMKVSFGTIYATLDRLLTNDLVRYELREGSEDRGCRPQRFFSVTGAGQMALHHAVNQDKKVSLLAFPNSVHGVSRS